MRIYRDYIRTENDDFELNIKPYLNNSNEAIAVRDDNLKIVYWMVNSRYE